jgi:hypothetical protein
MEIDEDELTRLRDDNARLHERVEVLTARLNQVLGERALDSRSLLRPPGFSRTRAWLFWLASTAADALGRPKKK